ncbi:hypothetical protein FDUTEX481_07180 [Tolypothrix sp. PCC 7601]|nr:hypothetical protein FDUTEX481_07180 [Tolypothrix sp. PCC 7601]
MSLIFGQGMIHNLVIQGVKAQTLYCTLYLCIQLASEQAIACKQLSSPQILDNSI